MGYVERADWRQHTSEFGAVRVIDGPEGKPLFAMELTVAEGDELFLWEPLHTMWHYLPSFGLIPDLVGGGPDGTALLRYAAIDWSQRPQPIEDLRAAARVATWGVQLTRVFDLLMATISGDVRGWFASPIVKIDLAGRVRVMFVSAAASERTMQRVPPEVIDQWPQCDERALVFVVGQLLLGLIEGRRPAQTPLGTVILRCLERDPARRFPTLRALRDALVICGGVRKEDPPLFRRGIWDDIDEGYGALALWRWDDAVNAFTRALAEDATNEAALAGRAKAEAHGGVCTEREPERFVWRSFRRRRERLPKPAPVTRPWADTQPLIAYLMREHGFREAVDLCEHTHATGADLRALHLITARCHLELGNLGHAIEHARQADAYDIACEAHQRKRDFADALALADTWTAAHPADGKAHHARGKALFAQKRYGEARAAFERALVLEPTLVAALYFRREVDIAMKHVRDQVGTSETAAPEIPEHLSTVRAALLAGSTSGAIALLRAETDDPLAQLLLANLLQAEQSFHEAIATYERVAARWPEHARAAHAAIAVCRAAVPRD